jgi:4'-phosphopantetheinyl transferase EntD
MMPVNGAARQRRASEIARSLGAPITPGERGAPRWPDGVVGCLTHCDGYRAAAVYKAWFPVTGRWPGFEDASFRLRRDGTCTARILVRDSPYGEFGGR